MFTVWMVVGCRAAWRKRINFNLRYKKFDYLCSGIARFVSIRTQLKINTCFIDFYPITLFAKFYLPGPS
jgi:hypothetical protein